MDENAQPNPIRINIGCGDVPASGWLNYDNSLTVRLASIPGLAWVLARGGFFSPRQHQFIEAVRKHGIRYADAVAKIPHSDNSVDVVYTCHMLEHLDRREAVQFLAETMRVLKPGGILRVVVPDLKLHARNYLEDDDADRFLDAVMLSTPSPEGFLSRIKLLIVGHRHHLWMYDEKSISGLIEVCGFSEVKSLRPGETRIPFPDGLDLYERSEESIFVEAVKPVS